MFVIYAAGDWQVLYARPRLDQKHSRIDINHTTETAVVLQVPKGMLSATLVALFRGIELQISSLPGEKKGINLLESVQEKSKICTLQIDL